MGHGITGRSSVNADTRAPELPWRVSGFPSYTVDDVGVKVGRDALDICHIRESLWEWEDDEDGSRAASWKWIVGACSFAEAAVVVPEKGTPLKTWQE